MYWVSDRSNINNARQITYFMDSDSDVENLPTSSAPGVQQGLDTISCLPCGKGSVALSVVTGKVFCLNSNDQWKEIRW